MSSMIRCREAVERLWAYLDDELDEAGHLAVEEHLRTCLRCCGEVEFARQVRDVLATRGRPDLPGDVERRLGGFIDRLEAPGADV